MTIYTIQATFGRGELTPKLHSRADIDHFKMGLKTCLNWMVMRQGGIRRRPGTQFIGEVKDSSKPVRLIPFIFSASQAYVLEMGDGYFRVYANGGRVGTVEVTTPWAAADLFQLDYDQTNDVLDVTHRAYQPRRISRQGHTSWSVAAVPTRDGPYLPLNATATTLTPNGTGNAVPVMTSNTTPAGYTAAASGNISGAPPWMAFDGDSTTRFMIADHAAWVSLQFPVPKKIVGYTIQSGTSTGINDPNNQAALNAPKSWTFEGFDGTNWIVLDSQFSQTSWSSSETRTFLFNNTTQYISYRLNVSSNNAGTYIEIASIAMLEDPASAPVITIAASSISGINNDSGFLASDVGRFISLLGSDAVYHPFQIVGVSSPTSVTVKASGSPLPVAQGTLQWKFGAWGSIAGWPAHVATFEQRKIYARTDAQPSGIWATKSGGYGTTLDFSVSVPIKDDDALGFTLTDVNEIQWIAEGSDLLIGTAGAARTMGRDSPNLPFSANNFRQSLASTYASQALRPVKAGSSTIFASTFGKAIREFVQADGGVGYETPDISVLSEHLFAPGVRELCYAQEPDSVVWMPNGKGQLVGLTYEKAQAMAGMHRHELGGNGFVESCCTIPGTDRNEIWMVVRRTINGATRRYIERMTGPFESATTSPDNAWFVDCGLQYGGAPVTTVTGLSHLEGLTVSILADGARETDQIVTGGAVSLATDRAASNIIVGLPYRSLARTLPSPISQGDGSGLGRRKKIVSAKADLFASGPVRVGRNMVTAEQINYRHTTDNLGAPPGLYTGFIDARPETSWSDGGEIEIVAEGPQPCMVRSVTLALEPEP